MEIASNEDVLNAISRRIEPEDIGREYSNYHIVSVENSRDAIEELEDLPSSFGFKLLELVIFTNFDKTRAYAYIKTRSAVSPWSVLGKFEDLGFHEVEVRIRRFGVKSTLVKSALRGGFTFGEYPFPLRPIYHEIELDDRQYHLERGVEYKERKQPHFVDTLHQAIRKVPLRRGVKK